MFTDLSYRKLLSYILGSNVGPIHLGSFSNPIIQDSFEKFNIFIFSIGLIIIAYVSILSTINTANDGKIMGAKGSAIWIPLRSILGIACIVPVPGSGYSTIQVFFIWMILQGCNFANQTWEVVTNYLEQGISLSRSVDVEPAQKIKLQKQGETLSKDLLNSAICLVSLQEISKGLAIDSSGSVVPPSDWVRRYGRYIGVYQSSAVNKTDDKYKGYIDIGANNSNDYDKVCGRYDAIAKVDSNELFNDADLSRQSKRAVNEKLNAIHAIFTYLLPVSKNIINVDNKNIEDRLSSAISKELKVSSEIYVNIMSNLIISHNRKDYLIELEKKKNDWVTVGLQYADLYGENKQIQLLKTAIQEPPTSSLLSSCKDNKIIGPLGNIVMSSSEEEYICSSFSKIKKASKESINFEEEQANENNDAKPIKTSSFKELINSSIVHLKNRIQHNANDEPMKLQTNFGELLLFESEDNLSKTNVQMNLSTIVPIVLWFCGAILIFYLPLIPSIMYTLSVIGWFLLVIENFFALPIIALGLLLPNGDDGRRIFRNLSLSVNAVIRPMMMVISFILAIRVYKIASEFINFIIINMTNSNVSAISLLSPVVTIIIYVFLIIIFANICFSLSYRIPNKFSEEVEKILIESESYALVQQGIPIAGVNQTIMQNSEMNKAITNSTNSSSSDAKKPNDSSGLNR